MRRGVVAIGLGLALAAAWPTGAEARNDVEGLVRVMSPTSGQGVFASGQAVKVAVRRGARLAVHVGGRDVTRALHLRTVRSGRRARTLRGLLPRRLVSGAPKTVAFEARARGGKRTDGDYVLVQRVIRRPGFMRLRLRRGGSRAPVEAIVHTRMHRIWLRARLNGRRIERVATTRRLGVRRLRLTRTEGLRPGRNVLEIAANSAGGRGDVERRVFRLPRNTTIPGVRALDHVRVGVPVRLDAGPSLASTSGGRLAYRWRFAARPRGSRARLRATTRRVASFRPDIPGRYSVQLVAGPADRRAAKAAADRAPLEAAAPMSSVVTDVTAQAPIPPYGLALRTDPQLGLTLDGATTPMPSGPAGMLVVTISSAAGAVTQTIEIPGGFNPQDQTSFHDVQTLLEALQDLSDPSELVVVIGAPADSQDASFGQGGAAFGNLEGALGGFGLDGGTAYDLATAVAGGGQFALVGAPGSVPGAGTVNSSAGSPAAGVLDGRLRLTGLSPQLTGAVVFEQPDYRLFELGGGQGSTMFSDLNPPSGATPSIPLDDPLSPGDSMEVTIVDAASLESVVSASGSAGGEDGALTPVRDLLASYLEDESKLILFKMSGQIAWENTRVDLSAISKMLASLGANRDIFIGSFDPAVDYVFLGGPGVQAVEGSSLITADAPGGGSVALSSPTLSGILRKNHRGQWIPVASRTTDQLTNSLQALATRAPVAYGYPTDVVPGTQDQYAAAEATMLQLLEQANVVCAPSSTCATAAGVRANYANEELLGNLSAAQTALNCKPDGTTDGALTPGSGATYTQAQLDALQAQVCGCSRTWWRCTGSSSASCAPACTPR